MKNMGHQLTPYPYASFYELDTAVLGSIFPSIVFH